MPGAITLGALQPMLRLYNDSVALLLLCGARDNVGFLPQELLMVVWCPWHDGSTSREASPVTVNST